MYWHGGGDVRHLLRDEIPLDSEMLYSLSRRARRRLRDLEVSSQTALQIDRSRQVLCVQGTAQGIAQVRSEVECRAGPRKSISPSLWAELLRTRKMEGPFAVLHVLQAMSQCRLHIERSRPEVRIFGTDAKARIAISLLDQLNEQCSTVSLLVDAGAWLSFSEERLEQLGRRLGATVRMEGKHIVIQGLACVVELAVVELRRLLSDMDHAVSDLSLSANEAVAQALASLKVQPSLLAREGHSMSDRLDETFDGYGQAVSESIHPFFPHQARPTLSTALPAFEDANSSAAAFHLCHHCGAPRFCSRCGNHNWGACELENGFSQGYAAPFMNSVPRSASGENLLPPYFADAADVMSLTGGSSSLAQRISM
mmetsp:Transcript_784/g.2153  ORF Transcript_784/g.2153 Transcript_784/m.2153 type:complete len:368 (-) Transcript_784:32-1135(-)